MIIFTVVRMFAHLFAGMATCAFLFPFLDRPARQARIRRWSARLVHICGLKIAIRDPNGYLAAAPLALASAGRGQALMVANHISWLDIFVINSLEPCRFVAKSDIRGWPLVGWLCAKTGTIFISRGRPRDVRAIYQGLVASIKAGDRIAFFPEGTTAEQGTLLPFHPNLFEAAIDAGVPVQPYALRYLDDAGALHPAANFIGETTIVESILAILKARGSRAITAELTVLAPLSSAGAHRRDLALAARAAIEQSLGNELAAARAGAAALDAGEVLSAGGAK
ncbi:1-acyl-sn-glycerol-3-phosphate acyltransferase [Oxalobacteraceae bacterium CAVE-383]|nr:1-acyl-sn-glycerol-3-phosphate acyltransferase [Oxalobacteraceae bacterium CAVE-383]